DAVTLNARWLAVLGDIGYTLLLRVNTPVNLFRRLFGMDYWSLSAFVKRKVKGAVDYISKFEHSVSHYAEINHADGIVCGHMHSASARMVSGVQYYNCGDWVESCTALVERFDGSIEILDWREHSERRNACEVRVIASTN